MTGNGPLKAVVEAFAEKAEYIQSCCIRNRESSSVS